MEFIFEYINIYFHFLFNLKMYENKNRIVRIKRKPMIKPKYQFIEK